jgi:transposase
VHAEPAAGHPGVHGPRARGHEKELRRFDRSGEGVFARDVLDGHLFLFLNRRRDRLKVLWWDRDGLALFCKRLERGTYEIPPSAADAQQLRLDATQLALLSGDVQLDSMRHRGPRVGGRNGGF